MVQLSRRGGLLSLVSPKRPLSASCRTGKMFSRSSLTRSCSISVRGLEAGEDHGVAVELLLDGRGLGPEGAPGSRELAAQPRQRA
jgi:hypothetical protein